MAKLYDVGSAGRLNWAMPFSRVNAFPIDRSSVFDTYADAVKYAKGDVNDLDSRELGGTSYVGQIISVLNTDIDDGEPKAYIISNTDGDLIEFIGGEISISQEEGNIISRKDDGIFAELLIQEVHDDDYWTTENPILKRGQIGISILEDGKYKIKVGDGEHAWNDIEYLSGNNDDSSSIPLIEYTTTTAPADAWNSYSEDPPKDGQMMIVQSSENSVTGYVWSETSSNWIAFSGNVLARNVYFDQAITCAGDYTGVGNITKKANEITTIDADGISLLDLVNKIFTKEIQPTKVEPNVSLTFNQAGEYEVGTTVTPVYSASLNAGSYSYGPSTGIVAKKWTIIDLNGNIRASASGTLPSFVVEDNTNYTISAKAEYNEGPIALTNMGNPSNPVVRIEAGSKIKTSNSIKGYRSFFYGILNDTASLTSEKIRGLTNGNKAKASKFTISVNGSTTAKRIIVAIPKSSKLNITKVSKTDGLVTDITNTYNKSETTVMVADAQTGGASNKAEYEIWIYQPSQIDSQEVHEITIG